MDDPIHLAGLEPADDQPDDGPMFDAPISVLSVAFCDDAFFG
jgi:hypothetical protein